MYCTLLETNKPLLFETNSSHGSIWCVSAIGNFYISIKSEEVDLGDPLTEEELVKCKVFMSLYDLHSPNIHTSTGLMVEDHDENCS